MSNLKRIALMILAVSLPLSVRAELPERVVAIARGLSADQKSKILELNRQRKAEINGIVAMAIAGAKSKAQSASAMATIRETARAKIQRVNADYLKKAKDIVANP